MTSDGFCIAAGCVEVSVQGQMCQSHYDSVRYSGGLSLEERFWAKVIKNEDGCYGWSAQVDSDGYGRIAVGRRRDGNKTKRGAHQISWEIHNGPIPDGMWVLHHCDNPPCTRIDHLYLGTVVENNRDRRDRKRGYKANWTHCAKGHEFTPENTHIRANGTRWCRACGRTNALKAYHASKERAAPAALSGGG